MDSLLRGLCELYVLLLPGLVVSCCCSLLLLLSCSLAASVVLGFSSVPPASNKTAFEMSSCSMACTVLYLMFSCWFEGSCIQLLAAWYWQWLLHEFSEDATFTTYRWIGWCRREEKRRERTDERTDERRRTGERTNERTNGRTDERTNERTELVSYSKEIICFQHLGVFSTVFWGFFYYY